MKFPPWLKVYGNKKYRDACPSEAAEQVTFIARVRSKYPMSYGRIIIHPKNEGARSFAQASMQKAEGLTTGAADVVIPGAPSFVCEIKRRDHTRSVITSEQIDYLRVCEAMGAFVVVALGCDAAEEALNNWISSHEK